MREGWRRTSTSFERMKAAGEPVDKAIVTGVKYRSTNSGVAVGIFSDTTARLLVGLDRLIRRVDCKRFTYRKLIASGGRAMRIEQEITA